MGNLTESTTKCSDTIGGNTPNTSGESRQQKPTSGSLTEQKLPGPGEMHSDAKSSKSVEVYREFLLTDLLTWIFRVQEREYTAYDSPADVWVTYMAEFADLDPVADWADLEERADFLTQLWTFCALEKLSFPLTEKFDAEVAIS